MVKTAMDFADAGIPTMIRARVANGSDYVFLHAAFPTASRWEPAWRRTFCGSPPTTIRYDHPLGAPVDPAVRVDAVLGVWTREFAQMHGREKRSCTVDACCD